MMSTRYIAWSLSYAEDWYILENWANILQHIEINFVERKKFHYGSNFTEDCS